MRILIALAVVMCHPHSVQGKYLLSQAETTQLLDCVHELHAFHDLSALRSWLLETALPRLIPSDSLSCNEVDLLHPENTRAIVKPEFQEACQHLGVEYQIAATLRLAPDCLLALALARRQTDYTERDRVILEILRPHLTIAFNRLLLAGRRQTDLDDAAQALHTLAAATISVNPRGGILNHTGPGLAWIGATSPGVLPAHLTDWLNRITAQPTLHLNSAAGRLHIRAVPTANRERLLLVLTRDQDRLVLPPVPGDGILSKRQWEVARWICQGKTNDAIAAILDISPRTVHKHVEHIFKKLGVESRHALSILLTQNN